MKLAAARTMTGGVTWSTHFVVECPHNIVKSLKWSRKSCILADTRTGKTSYTDKYDLDLHHENNYYIA